MADADKTQAEAGHDDNRPVTMADVKALFADLDKRTAETVNRAITARDKRAKEVADKVAAAAKEAAANGESDGGEGGDEAAKAAKAAEAAKAKAQQGQPDPEIAKLQTKIAELHKAQKDADKRAAEAERRRVEAQGYATAKGALAKVLRPDAVDDVVDLLKARGRIVIDDEGNARMKIKAAPEKGLPEEEMDLPIEKAVPLYAASKEAALYVPPPKAVPRGGPTTIIPSRQGGATQRQDPVGAFEAQHGKLEDHL